MLVKSGTDRYAFKKISNQKNKYGTPFRKGLMRIWISDHKGRAWGPDPVFDTYEFLRTVGCISKSKGTFKIVCPHGKLDDLKGYSWTWQTFKAAILAEVMGGATDHTKNILAKAKAPTVKIRENCYKLMREGLVEDMLSKAIAEDDLQQDDDIEEQE